MMATSPESFLLIGSPPSSGSTLFSILLDKHSKISCGGECSLLSNPVLFRNTKTFGDYLHVLAQYNLFGGLKGRAALENGLAPTGLIYEDHLASYEHNYSSVMEILRGIESLETNVSQAHPSAQSFSTPNGALNFLDRFFSPRAKKNGKVLMAEKTPGNIFSIKDFLGAIPQGKVILIVRHPYDTIYSLMNRGYSLGMAAAIYLTHASICASFRNTERCLLIKMEDLLQKPHETLGNVFDFIGVTNESKKVLSNENADRSSDGSTIKLKRWNASPLDELNPSVIGKGKANLSRVEKMFVDNLHLADDDLAPTDIFNMRELSKVLGYTLDSPKKVTADVLGIVMREKIPISPDLQFYSSYEISRVYFPIMDLSKTYFLKLVLSFLMRHFQNK